MSNSYSSLLLSSLSPCISCSCHGPLPRHRTKSLGSGTDVNDIFKSLQGHLLPILLHLLISTQCFEGKTAHFTHQYCASFSDSYLPSLIDPSSRCLRDSAWLCAGFYILSRKATVFLKIAQPSKQTGKTRQCWKPCLTSTRQHHMSKMVSNL